MVDIKLTSEPLDVSHCADWVQSPDCGGIDIFIGTVRNITKGKTVKWLEFEAYEKMAISEMKKIADAALTKWPVKKLLIHHRTGKLDVGDIPVVIAVSTAHRDAAFVACRYVIDTLKQTVPIWKKEIFEDGEVWVSAFP